MGKEIPFRTDKQKFIKQKERLRDKIISQLIEPYTKSELDISLRVSSTPLTPRSRTMTTL